MPLTPGDVQPPEGPPAQYLTLDTALTLVTSIDPALRILRAQQDYFTAMGIDTSVIHEAITRAEAAQVTIATIGRRKT